MKHVVAFSSVVALAIWAVSLQPGGEPMEAQAALAVSQPSAIKCTSTACQDGWDSAYIAAVGDESECHLISQDREEIQGCRAFVQDSLQALIQDESDGSQ